MPASSQPSGGVTGLSEGTSVAVYGPWGMRTCHFCSRGLENDCSRAAELGIAPPGLGNPGAMAEYMLVDDPRHLVPLGDLDPVSAVPLTDAGLTPYHAIKPTLPKLVGGTTAVVIGVAVRHVGIQLLRHLTPRASSLSTSPTRSSTSPGRTVRTKWCAVTPTR